MISRFKHRSKLGLEPTCKAMSSSRFHSNGCTSVSSIFLTQPHPNLSLACSRSPTPPLFLFAIFFQDLPLHLFFSLPYSPILWAPQALLPTPLTALFLLLHSSIIFSSTISLLAIVFQPPLCACVVNMWVRELCPSSISVTT